MGTLRDIQSLHKSWAAYNFGEDRESWGPLLGAMEELGELAHAHLKEHQKIRVGEDHTENAKDAVGDIIMYLMDYCSIRGFDIEEIIIETWLTIKQRDWKKDPKDADKTRE
jgi:NTP pyrophosphatase (non-canonical NTP hydrolase)